MSKKLRQLLDAEEPLFTHSIRKLEELTNLSGVDNRLAVEIDQKAKAVTRSLGLDPDDTTDAELYYAQVDRIRVQNENLASALGTTARAPIKEMVPHLVRAARQAKVPSTCWALKKSVAKDLLRQMPPKKMMKHLGYRSLESMIKNERFSEIYTALRFSEGADWLNKYNELFKSVKPSDFESRKIDIVIMDHDKWSDVTAEFVEEKKHNVTHTKELGAIVIVPMPMEFMPGLPLKTLPMIIHYINEIRLYSAFFKMKQVQPDFGEIVVDTINADPSNAAVIAGRNIHWRVIQRYFGKLPKENYPEIFQPHVQPEDLHWRKTMDAMCDMSPELKIWEDMEYVGILARDGNPVSFNFADFGFGYSNEDEFDERNFYHMREALWNELIMRYLGHSVIEKQILEQLDNSMIKPEELIDSEETL